MQWSDRERKLRVFCHRQLSVFPKVLSGHGQPRFHWPSLRGPVAGRLTRPARSRYGPHMDKKKKPSRQQVYTLVVQIGRKSGDGLPDDAVGAALMCYASGIDEAEAVRETVAILKQADTAPLDVTGYGTVADREAEGHEISDEEHALMARALEENAVIVAQMTPFFDEPAQDS